MVQTVGWTNSTFFLDKQVTVSIKNCGLYPRFSNSAKYTSKSAWISRNHSRMCGCEIAMHVDGLAHRRRKSNRLNFQTMMNGGFWSYPSTSYKCRDILKTQRKISGNNHRVSIGVHHWLSKHLNGLAVSCIQCPVKHTGSANWATGANADFLVICDHLADLLA